MQPAAGTEGTINSPIATNADTKPPTNQPNTSNACQQQSLIPTALSRISEDSPRAAAAHRCLNIAGIEKYPEIQGGLPRAWSVPVLAPHVRAYLEAPLVCICINLRSLII